MASKVLRTVCTFGNDCPTIRIDDQDGGDVRITGYTPGAPQTPENERDIVVPPTMLPELADLDVPDLDAFVTRVAKPRGDRLRIQTLPFYGVPSDQDFYLRYTDGRPGPTAAELAGWGATLDAERAAGRTWRNLHVLDGEPGSYVRYMFEWGYSYNVAHGMDVRVLDATNYPAAAALVRLGDYWVIEHEHVVLCHYKDGVPQGRTRVEAQGAHGYIAAAEMAWQLGTPFTAWWAAHPQYHRRPARAA